MLAVIDELHDAAGDETGDLHHADALAIGALQREGLALVVERGLVEIGVEEEARHIGDAANDGIERRAVHMHVEDIHEHRDAGDGLTRQVEFDGRDHLLDGADAAIGRRDDETVAQRRHALGIAEEIGAPQGEHHARPGQRPEMQPEQDQRHARKGGDEAISLPVDRDQDFGNGFGDRHGLGSSELEGVWKAFRAYSWWPAS